MFTLLTIISVIAIIYAIVGRLFRLDKTLIQLPFIFPTFVAGLILFILSISLVSVTGQEVAVVITPSGVTSTPLKTGWHIVPFWNHIEYMDKTVWVYTFSSKEGEGAKVHSDAIWSPTKDGIKMGLDLSLSWKIEEDYAPWIFANVSEQDGKNRYVWIEENLIRPKAKSVIALTVSEYTPIEVYSSKRQDIQTEVQEKLAKELQVYHLSLAQTDIREVFYNPEYETAINQKKLAEQEVLRLIEVTKQKNEQLKQREIDKNMTIATAEGESRALQIKGQSISNNPKIIQLEWIQKWNGKLPEYVAGGNAMMLMQMPTMAQEK